MRVFLRVFGCLVLISMVTGCSSPGIRAKDHADAFRRLSSSDQRLVLSGRVRPGLSQDGVYIAWGEPDRKTTGGTGKDVTETWVYQQRVTIYEPINAYDYFGPNHGYGEWPREPWLRPGFGSGGFGNEGLLQYQPHVRSLDVLRIAEFSGGRVDRYKDGNGGWSNPPVEAAKKAPATSQAPKRTPKKIARATKAKGHVHKAIAHTGESTGKKQAGRSPRAIGKAAPKHPVHAKHTAHQTKSRSSQRSHGSHLGADSSR